MWSMSDDEDFDPDEPKEPVVTDKWEGEDEGDDKVKVEQTSKQSLVSRCDIFVLQSPACCMH